MNYDGEISPGESSMTRVQQFTAIIEREGDGYVSLCPELDIASQGDSVEESKNNLLEALQLFCEVAYPSEIENRLHTEVFVTRLEVAIG
jgi:predicted RNase H-like HicB family nuclease